VGGGGQRDAHTRLGVTLALAHGWASHTLGALPNADGRTGAWTRRPTLGTGPRLALVVTGSR
jgi:hypothetical protein